ncbi:GAK6 protein, partial [Steatornis caripensis]|nr:GAK6 protein [Steatornis caripensis]
MERQAAYDLLKCFLEKRGIKGIDCRKELPGLLAYGLAKGCFINPDTIFEREEWRKFGDTLFREVIDDDKTAKKLMKPWRAVINALDGHHAEQRAASAASARLGATKDLNSSSGAPPKPEDGPYPLPPSYRTMVIGGSEHPEESARNSVPEETFPPPPVAPSAPREEGERPDGELNTNPFLKNPFTPQADSRNPFTPQADSREAVWRRIAQDAILEGDPEAAAQLSTAFPVVYSPPDAQGRVNVQLTTLDWKLLTQLCATVNDSGLKGEATHQMLDYIWDTNILLPGDIRSIMKLILTQHQQLLFNAHWQTVCQEAVAVQRGPGDPLYGVTLDELMGLGNYLRVEAQALMGPDKAKASMNLARRALEHIRNPGGIPSYMEIKQGREEPFDLFINRVANAIQAAGVPDYLKGTILKQCAIQNCNSTTRSILTTLPATWTIEEGLERITQVPVGPQAMLVEAIKHLGNTMKEQTQAIKDSTQQAQNQQSQVLAALAPLQTPGGRSASRKTTSDRRCFRCGTAGHVRRDCRTESVWCQNCQSNTHNTSACRRGAPGNGRNSGKNRPATTQKAAFTTTSGTTAPVHLPPFGQPPEGALDWTWQQQ